MAAGVEVVVVGEEVDIETEATTADGPLPPTTAAGEGAATTGPDLALTLLVSIVATSFAICNSCHSASGFSKMLDGNVLLYC